MIFTAAQTNPQTPGYKTSEFAITVGGSVGIGLLAMGLISNEMVDPVTQLVTTAVAGASAIFTIGWLIVSFVRGRRDLKQLLIEKGIIVQGGKVPSSEPQVSEPVVEVPTQG